MFNVALDSVAATLQKAGLSESTTLDVIDRLADEIRDREVGKAMARIDHALSVHLVRAREVMRIY
jgi:hypothetical protein